MGTVLHWLLAHGQGLWVGPDADGILNFMDGAQDEAHLAQHGAQQGQQQHGAAQTAAAVGQGSAAGGPSTSAAAAAASTSGGGGTATAQGPAGSTGWAGTAAQQGGWRACCRRHTCARAPVRAQHVRQFGPRANGCFPRRLHEVASAQPDCGNPWRPTASRFCRHSGLCLVWLGPVLLCLCMLRRSASRSAV